MCEDGQPSNRSPAKADKPPAKGEFDNRGRVGWFNTYNGKSELHQMAPNIDLDQIAFSWQSNAEYWLQEKLKSVNILIEVISET